jgi:predicted MPP superfamily phosphohydrolase
MPKELLSRRTVLKMAVGVMGLGLGSLAYGHYFESSWVEITTLRLKLPRLAPEFHGYRLVQLSDIHLDHRGMTRTRLAEIARLVNGLRPDLVAITGDFITVAHDGGPRIFVEDLAPALSLLTPHDATVAVLGNHDQEQDPITIRRALQMSGIVDLSNTVYTLWRNKMALHIAGVDDLWTGQDRLDLVLKRLPAEGAAILLAHEPDFANTSAKTGRFGLQLSGHSHGGQVILPFLGPPILPRYARNYPVGRYQVGEMTLYTNRGLGTVPPRIRINCRPEITLFILEG